MLRWHAKNLRELPHRLDHVVVVSNAPPRDSGDYFEATQLFDAVMYRENVRGSYGAWKHAWDYYGDTFDWYFLLEDDYIMMAPDFDAKLIALWEPGMGYLAGMIGEHGLPMHFNQSSGLASAEGFKAADFTEFEKTSNIYDSAVQIEWSKAFIDSPLKTKQIHPHYDVPYFTGQQIWRFAEKETIFGPVQMYNPQYHIEMSPR